MPAGPAIELADVPFFAQQRYQCGPAALATLLVDSGVDVTPESLVPLVYVPGRKGSFQVELKASARAFGRIPFEPRPETRALFAEVAAGNPVLVLQNLAFAWLPKWHYAVVVGFDPQRRRVILRSGTRERSVQDMDRFLRSWRLADYWSMTVLRPGQLPATATAPGYVELIAENEERLDPAAATAMLEAGLAEWPAHADLAFAAGNYARMHGDEMGAARLYRRALSASPTHTGVLNNYADLLLAAGCLSAAESRINAARDSIDQASPLYRTVLQTAQQISNALRSAGPGDAGARCAALIASR